jgi:hypothetical protein
MSTGGRFPSRLVQRVPAADIVSVGASTRGEIGCGSEGWCLVVRWGDQLGRCQGHTVLAADGRFVGKVRWLQYQTQADCPDALAVRRRSIFGQRRDTLIPEADVAEVRATEKLVLLRCPVALDARRLRIPAGCSQPAQDDSAEFEVGPNKPPYCGQRRRSTLNWTLCELHD